MGRRSAWVGTQSRPAEVEEEDDDDSDGDRRSKMNHTAKKLRTAGNELKKAAKQLGITQSEKEVGV